ncbi:MAG: hypothetical protein QOF76_2345 [Solirubrobacteraceae bacterium]|jgi:ubiquinone/menaquinone biosynthesis C-methylase UbiE|nr:hypothetical protein [Solirubrobacteraceae bacterium]
MSDDADAIRARTAAVWGKGEYYRVAERLIGAAEALVEAAGIARGQAVLDVAAGTGNVAATAAARHALVTATDLSPAMVELGEQRTIGADVKWLEADAEHLPFDDGSFDAALSVMGAIFAPDAQQAVSELLRVVTPGGVIGLTAWVDEGVQAEVAAYIGEVSGGPGMMNDWGQEAFARRMLEGASSVEVQRRTLHWEFEDKQAWLDFFERGPGPMAALQEKLGEEAWAPVRARMLEIVAAHVGAGDGPFVIEPPYLLILARR